MLYLYSIIMQLTLIVVPIIGVMLWKQSNAYTVRDRWISVGIAAVVLYLESFFTTIHFLNQFIDFTLLPILIITIGMGYRYGFTLLIISIVLSSIIPLNVDWHIVTIRVAIVLCVFAFIYLNKLRFKFPQDQNRDILRMFLFIYLIRISLLLILDFSYLEKQTLFSLFVVPSLEILVFQFVMRFHQLQQDYNRRKQEFAEAEKQKVVSALAASIAHEIRNPITVVKGFLQLLNDNPTLMNSSKRDQYFELCLSELERAEFIIKDYLSFSKPNEANSSRMLINESIDKVLSIVQSYSNLNNIELSYDYQQTHNVKISAFKEKVEQILLNMVKNAIEACSNVGHARVMVKTEYIANKIKIYIQDNGPGIDHAILNHIGQAFQSTKATGTGLGLMVSKKLIEDMRGSFAIHNLDGKGCRVEIQFPIK